MRGSYHERQGQAKLIEPTIAPVEPSVRETEITRKGEQASTIVLKYLKGVSLVYDIDEKWLVREVLKKLDWELRD